jgi:hypothetical protein
MLIGLFDKGIEGQKYKKNKENTFADNVHNIKL